VSGAREPAPAPPLLVDTHALIWLTDGSRKLGERSKAAIRQAYREDRATISAITPWEIALLVSKGRVTLGQTCWIGSILCLLSRLRLTPLEPEIA